MIQILMIQNLNDSDYAHVHGTKAPFALVVVGIFAWRLTAGSGTDELRNRNETKISGYLSGVQTLGSEVRMTRSRQE
jgi:hypothetical protein